MNTDKLKNVVEGFLFASDKALTADQLVKLFPEGEQPAKEDVQAAIDAISESFQGHGIELKQVRSGYRFQVRQEYAGMVSRLWDEKPAKYTRAMLETLALIVYRQPITRGEIEEIRGVSVSSHIIKTLIEREWVKVIGHRDVPGRPALYASTKEFLDYFNLKSLEELPPLSEIKDLDSIATELDPEQNAALISAIREMQKENKTEGEPDNVEADSESNNDSQGADSDVSDQNIEVVENADAEQTDEPTETDTEKETAETAESKSTKSFSDLVSKFTSQDDSTESKTEENEQSVVQEDNLAEENVNQDNSDQENTKADKPVESDTQ